MQAVLLHSTERKVQGSEGYIIDDNSFITAHSYFDAVTGSCG